MSRPWALGFAVQGQVWCFLCLVVLCFALHFLRSVCGRRVYLRCVKVFIRLRSRASGLASALRSSIGVGPSGLGCVLWRATSRCYVACSSLARSGRAANACSFGASNAIGLGLAILSQCPSLSSLRCAPRTESITGVRVPVAATLLAFPNDPRCENQC